MTRTAFVSLAVVLTFALGCVLLWPSSVFAQQPGWQTSALGLTITHGGADATAGLGFVVKAPNWPSISLHGGVQYDGSSGVKGPTGIELGAIAVPGVGTAALTSESADWAHDEMSFSAGASVQLKLWVTRLSSAVLLQSSATTLRLLSGDVAGSVYNGSSVVPRPLGPSYPKYVAYSSGGAVHVQALGSAPTDLRTSDENWILVWYAANSHFVDSKKPLSYTGFDWTALPYTAAYQADAPMLLVFQNRPTSIKQSSVGGVELTFGAAAGYVSLLPLFGREHPSSATTATWAQTLPAEVVQKARWWASHLCAFPVTASETYAYDAGTDTANITERISSLNVCSGGTPWAPIPPMVGIARDALGVSFSGQVIDGNLPTEFGPSLGIENVNQYSWTVAGLRRYTDDRRQLTGTGQVPSELQQKLDAEAAKIVAAGHFAPWAFSDTLPVHDYRGDVYWLNPSDVLVHLTEIAEALPDNARPGFINYIRAERSAYPPESVYNLPLDKGARREPFSVTGTADPSDTDALDRFRQNRPDVFLSRVPLYSLYGLARYYDLTGDPLPAATWVSATKVLSQTMNEQDWATGYWFNGFAEPRPVAVVSANRHFAGLVGFVKMAELANDTAAEGLGRALLAKAAVLRVAMAQYPRYLYSASLVDLPSQPDWQPKYAAGGWQGQLFNYSWTGAYDDARQVRTLDQFGTQLADHSATAEDWDSSTSAYLTAFRDMVPELARLLADKVKADAEIYVDKVEAFSPQWYAAFAEGVLGQEHNLSHPIDSFQIFMAKALIQQEPPENLARYVDIPWLEAGDLFYAQKLAETIKAYRGWSWVPVTAAHSAIPRAGLLAPAEVVPAAMAQPTPHNSALEAERSQPQAITATQRVNTPHFAGDVLYDQCAVFWFGRVNSTDNYADVRVGYNDSGLTVNLNVIDRLLWYDTSPSLTDLDAWDTVSLYLSSEGATGSAATTSTYRFDAQLSWWEPRGSYQASYIGSGSGWTHTALPFSTSSAWRSMGGPNSNDVDPLYDDRGWVVEFVIPFSSLGLSAPPVPGSSWGLALVVHDRDDAAGTAIPDTDWPENVDELKPASWGQLVFGLPSYTPGLALPGELVTIRQGLNGASVPDGDVGGHSVCGDPFNPDFYNGWGDANAAVYSQTDQVNIQNQRDVADWPCFSKFYVTFPLTALPAGKTVISATLTMHQFGNAGAPGEAYPSLIQVSTVAEDWTESTLTWNNAPLAVENVSAAWAYPMTSPLVWPGVPVSWDVSRAVAEAYGTGKPLRLALYEADGPQHSGKYFTSSDAADWDAEGRPTLRVLVGQSLGVLSQIWLPLIMRW